MATTQETKARESIPSAYRVKPCLNLLLLIAEQPQIHRKQVRLIYCIKMKTARNVLTATSEYKLSRVASSSSYFTLLSGLSIFSSFLVRLLNQVPYSKFRGTYYINLEDTASLTC